MCSLTHLIAGSCAVARANTASASPAHSACGLQLTAFPASGIAVPYRAVLHRLPSPPPHTHLQDYIQERAILSPASASNDYWETGGTGDVRYKMVSNGMAMEPTASGLWMPAAAHGDGPEGMLTATLARQLAALHN